MPTLKKGQQKRYQVVFEEASEVQLTLLEWAEKRGLSPGKAIRCLVTDWSDALNGKPNPFALVIAAGVSASQGQVIQTEPEMSAEEKARQAALLQAAEQFL